MKGRNQKSILVSLLLIFTLILAACSGGNKTSGESEKKSTGKPVQGGDLVIGSIAEPTLFNSLYSTDVASSDIEERIYSLLQTDGKLNPQLSLAEDIKESDDGKQFDVTIRKGVKFHDGEELTADDVVFTYSIPINKDWQRRAWIRL